MCYTIIHPRPHLRIQVEPHWWTLPFHFAWSMVQRRHFEKWQSSREILTLQVSQICRPSLVSAFCVVYNSTLSTKKLAVALRDIHKDDEFTLFLNLSASLLLLLGDRYG
jgi:hypothetical protein